ncbi:MAG: hypothetical protein QWI36_05050 [Wolbachia endosymbiont of Tyrophagus putrescentiae]|nr:hypothetical protein [Wolbachia endosymbiont of Tyrophagus putrescentiae]
MSNTIIVPFNDKKGGTYELNIDLDKLSKDGMSAIKGIGHTVQKNHRVDNDLSKLLKVLDNTKNINIFAGEKPPSQNTHDKISNWEKGLNNFYNTKSLHYARNTNPFVPHLSKIDPSGIESRKLRWFKDEVIKARTVGELNKAVDQGLNSGIRINACYEGEESFTDVVMLKMLSVSSTKDDKESIMYKLLLNGAFFSYNLSRDKQVSEAYNKSYSKVKPEIEKKIEELKKVGRDAVQEGRVEGAEIDNQTFFIQFSEGSTVKPAKVAEGARNLGLNKGEIKLGSHIIKIGRGEFEFKTDKEGTRNYIDMSDNSSFTMKLHSSIGELRIVLQQNCDRVQVRVENKEMWKKLQETGGIIRENCLLGGMKIEEAIREGSFKRRGTFSKEQVTKEVSSSEEISLWVNRVCKDGKEMSR